MKRGPITVLQFVNKTVRGGAEDHVLTLLTHLNRSLFCPMLVAPPEQVETIRRDLPSDVEAIALTPHSLRHPPSAWRFWRLLSAKRVDILHSHMFHSSTFAAPLGWMARVPVRIETAHLRGGRLKAGYFVDRVVAHFVTDFIAVSAANGRYLEGQRGIRPEKISVIRSGVPFDRFDPNRTGPPELRDSIGIERNAPVVLVPARLEAQKGHRVLLEAWKAVCASFPTARLVCVGDGSLRNELEAMAAETGITNSVRFVGYQRNVCDWLALADFTVLPSFYEDLPLVVLESLAAGRAVITSLIDGTSEVVLDGHTGLAVPPGRPAPLATGICELLASSDLARRMGREGRRLVEERFSQRRQVAETEALYLRSWRARTGGNPWPEVSSSFAIDSARRSRMSRSALGNLKNLSRQNSEPSKVS